MVLLTMTTAIVQAIEARNNLALQEQPEQDHEPSLDDPQVDKPISHGQIVQLWKDLQPLHGSQYSLEKLLRGSKVYIPPPPPKPEPTDEYKALMARLRREEEERKYQRMVANSASHATTMPSFAQQFPNSSSALAHSFAQVHRPSSKEDEGDDDVTYNDVHRQVMLVINFLVTIFGCAATLWILARWWDTPARLFLTLGGSVVVGVAEVGVYYAYVWHLGEAKRQDGKVKEVKQVVDTWVVGREEPPKEITDQSKALEGDEGNGTSVRLRKGTKHEET